jgi:SMI1-KNR4 cell-wall
MIGFRSANEPASEDAVRDAERQLEVALPVEYRLFLTTQANGGKPEDNLFRAEGEDPGASIRYFFGVGLPEDADHDIDLVRRYDFYRDRVPSWAVPVGEDGTGNLILISIREDDLGSVWFWDHELEAEEGEPATEENLTLLAGGFDEFLSRLEPLSDDDLPEADQDRGWIDPAFAEEMRRQGLMD